MIQKRLHGEALARRRGGVAATSPDSPRRKIAKVGMHRSGFP